MKKNITDRFILSINYLIEAKFVKTKLELSVILGISNTKFSEILNYRMYPGVELYALLVEKFNICPKWLLTGEGEMLNKTNNAVIKTPCSTCVDKDTIISLQNKLIKRLEDYIDSLEQTKVSDKKKKQA